MVFASLGASFGQRYYDPTTGRWTQQDPISKIASPVQADRFLYAGGDPINNSDPNGLSLEGEIEEGVEEGVEKVAEGAKECVTGGAISVLATGDPGAFAGGCGTSVVSYGIKEAGYENVSKALELSSTASDFFKGAIKYGRG